MIQQIIAIVIIAFFVVTLIGQRRKGGVTGTEFVLWSIFWTISILVVVFIQKVDAFVAYLGFGSTGVEVMLYLAVAVFFHLLFKLRLKIARMERDITFLVRKISKQEED